MAMTAVQLVTQATAQIENVSPQEAAAELASGDVVLLDVREPVEWEQYIAGAVQVPRGVLKFSADPTSPRHNPALDPTRRVIVYCRSGARAALAVLTLKNLGFGNVANLTGGITAWKNADLPTADVHAGLQPSSRRFRSSHLIRARRVVPLIGRSTGWSEETVLALTGAGYFAIAAIGLLRAICAMLEAGRRGVPSAEAAQASAPPRPSS